MWCYFKRVSWKCVSLENQIYAPFLWVIWELSITMSLFQYFQGIPMEPLIIYKKVLFISRNIS